ncbi:MAG: F0F1 ATP synthase subunit epsilon [Pseudomonadota bacterium]
MADNFTFELVSPERLLVSEEASIVTLPGADGDMGVLANHAPLMTSLRPGVLTVTAATGGDDSYFVRGGFADIGTTGVTVLAEFAVKASEMTQEMFDAQKSLVEAELEEAKTEANEDKMASTQAYLDQLTHMERSLVTA